MAGSLWHSARDTVSALRRRSWNLGIQVGRTTPGGNYVLIIALVVPIQSALALPVADTIVSWSGLAVFAVLYLISQWITISRPAPLRLALFVGMAALSLAGTVAFGSEWVVAVAMTAAAASNVLPLIVGALAGIVVLAATTLLMTASPVGALVVLGAGAIALLRARLMVELARSRAGRQALARAAVDNERLRIARDLHDLLGHSLVTMVVHAELAERLVRQDPAGTVAAVQEVQRVGREAMTEVQHAVTGYRTRSLSDELQRVQDSLAPLRGAVTMQIAEREWSPEVDAVLAWAVREAATNILRHADATRASITVSVRAEQVVLTVINDDLGVTGHAGPTGGRGLAGLRERAAELGGTITGGASTSGEFRLVVTLPCWPHSSEAQP